ncbi:MAG: sensor histidine kinase, partial [Chloroflexota bacterium]
MPQEPTTGQQLGETDGFASEPRRERPAEQSQESLPKPFPLVLYYTIASVLVIAAALVTVNFISQRVERQSVIARLMDESIANGRIVALSLAELLHIQQDGISVVEEVSNLDRVVLNTIRGQPIVRLDIINPSGRVLYSTSPDAPASVSGAFSEAMDQAETEVQWARYADDERVTRLTGRVETYDVVETMIPLFPERGAGSGPVEPSAYFLLTRDVTGAVEEATARARDTRLITVAGVMTALFFVLLGIVIAGERAIRRATGHVARMLAEERSLREKLDEQNQELQAANEARTRLLSTVAHELRNPLTGISAFVDILGRNGNGNGADRGRREQRALEAIRRNTKQLNMLTGDLLDVSRLHGGRLRLELEQVELMGLLREVAEMQEPVLAEKEQELIADIQASEVMVHADRGRISQVVTNLLSNASKYSPEGTEVRISAYAWDSEVTVEVSDQGMGIPKADQEKLFTEFFRAENARASGLPGTGLGLAITKSVIEMHGGAVSLDSEEGKGSTVRVT